VIDANELYVNNLTISDNLIILKDESYGLIIFKINNN
jgi:hypothetical protein